MSMQQSQSQPNQGAGPKPGTPVIADVYAKPGSGGIDFSLEWRFEGDSDPRKDPIDIPAKKADDPGTAIHFHLHDETTRKLQFEPDGGIWVSRSQCPQQSSSDPEIPSDQVKSTPNLLKVYDANQDKCDLRYTLLFRDSEGKAEAFDPMIRNGGTI